MPSPLTNNTGTAVPSEANAICMPVHTNNTHEDTIVSLYSEMLCRLLCYALHAHQAFVICGYDCCHVIFPYIHVLCYALLLFHVLIFALL